MRNSLAYTLGLASLSLALTGVVGCGTSPSSETKREELKDDAKSSLKKLENEDAGLSDFISKAYGYAVFPSVGKGGLLVGGAYGRAEVYEQGEFVGYASLTQASVGLQAGGQEFTELVVFENKDAMERFKNNRVSFAANASAVALKSGAAASAKYDNGVAVFTKPTGGLMFEASIGGQQFTFKAK